MPPYWWTNSFRARMDATSAAASLFVPGEPLGFITVRGVASDIGGDFRLPRFDRLNNYQWSDSLFWTHGAHSLRLGFQGQRIQFNQYSLSQLGGIVTFNNVTAFLKGQVGQIDWVLPQEQDGVRAYRQWLWGFYGQDDYKVRPNLTLNLGLRYEFVTTPTEKQGKISNLRTPSDPAITVGDPWHSNPSVHNFAPRVGVAWDPFKTGKTSVRAGFGIFYDSPSVGTQENGEFSNPPFAQNITISTTVLNNPGSVVANVNLSPPALTVQEFDWKQPYVQEWSLDVQRGL